MRKEAEGSLENMEKNIAKQREDEKVQQRLYEEFRQLDVNGDGMITIEEIYAFLESKLKVINGGWDALILTLSFTHLNIGQGTS